MAPRLPGWYAERSTTRWAARLAWVFAFAITAVLLLGLLVQNTALEQHVEPGREGFPTGGGDDGQPSADRDPGGGSPDDRVFEDEPSVGSGRHTEREVP